MIKSSFLPNNWFRVILAISFLVIGFISNAQNQKIADSLKALYASGNYLDYELDLLNDIAMSETNSKESLAYSEKLITLAAKDSLFRHLKNGYLQKGNSLKMVGDNVLAIEAYFKSLEYANRIKNEQSAGSISIAIAGVYSSMGNSTLAKSYYLKGIKILRKGNDSISIASALLNAGDEYFNTGRLDSAQILTEEATSIFFRTTLLIGQAYSLGNLGMILAEQGKDELAEKKIAEAIEILEELEDYYPICVYLTYMADIYLNKNDWTSALSYGRRSLDLAIKHNLKEQERDANLKLSELFEAKGDFESSNAYLKEFYTNRDSIVNIQSVRQIAGLRTNYEVSQKQIEVDLLSQKQKVQRIQVIATIIALVLIAMLAFGLYRRNIFIRKTSSIIQTERDRSNKLLLNILPEETAQELMDNGKVKAKKINKVSVLFTDFKGFTRLSADLSPEKLVESVNFYYSKFDQIVEKFGLEKIKTMGDAYMMAGGLPFPTEDHALKVVGAAFEISKFVSEAKKDSADGIMHFDIRIGINTGPVVAGVVGIKKFAYDIWGDTVNIASRMESNSEPGKINVSEATYQLIKHKYKCTYRGEIEAKNKGLLKMYFVDGILPVS
jgi:adenylate cyclase